MLGLVLLAPLASEGGMAGRRGAVFTWYWRPLAVAGVQMLILPLAECFWGSLSSPTGSLQLQFPCTVDAPLVGCEGSIIDVFAVLRTVSIIGGHLMTTY